MPLQNRAAARNEAKRPAQHGQGASPKVERHRPDGAPAAAAAAAAERIAADARRARALRTGDSADAKQRRVSLVSLNIGAQDMLRLHELVQFLGENNATGVIIMVQEIGKLDEFRTWAKGHLEKSDYLFECHNPYRNNRNNGVAFILHKSIRCVVSESSQLTTETKKAHLTSMTATFTFPTSSGDKTLRVANVYMPCIGGKHLKEHGIQQPEADDLLAKQLHHLLTTADVVAGDFNCDFERHDDGDEEGDAEANARTRRGNKFRDVAGDALGRIGIPTKATFVRNGCTTTLDYFLLSAKRQDDEPNP